MDPPMVFIPWTFTVECARRLPKALGCMPKIRHPGRRLPMGKKIPFPCPLCKGTIQPDLTENPDIRFAVCETLGRLPLARGYIRWPRVKQPIPPESTTSFKNPSPKHKSERFWPNLQEGSPLFSTNPLTQHSGPTIVTVFKIGRLVVVDDARRPALPYRYPTNEKADKYLMPLRHHISLLSGFILIFLILSGCAGLGRRLEAPRITLSNFSVQEIKVFESVFKIELRVFNTNDTPLEIKGLNCDLEINGKRLATGVANVKTDIPSYETGIVPMTLYSSVLDVMEVLRGLAKTDKLQYTLKGRLRLGKGAIPSTIPFTSTGELPLKEFVIPTAG
jgi:LEA14-like dessication related protein